MWESSPTSTDGDAGEKKPSLQLWGDGSAVPSLAWGALTTSLACRHLALGAASCPVILFHGGVMRARGHILQPVAPALWDPAPWGPAP